MQRHLRKLLVVVVVLAAVATALTSSAPASVFENSSRWPSDPRPGGGRGYAVIPICIVTGSSVFQFSDDDSSGAYTERMPEITTVIDAIRSALRSTWEANGAVRFTDWRWCADLSEDEQAKAVGFYISPDAKNEGNVGTNAMGRTTKDDPGTQIKPWGPEWNSDQCIKFKASVLPPYFHYDLSCAQQYAVHEFGHLLGFLHEWRNPAKPASCDDVGEGQIPASEVTQTWQTGDTYTIVNPDDYDWDSVMVYGPDCAHVTGERFGSPTPSPYDIAGLKDAYPPIDDVGVLSDGSCGDAEQVDLTFGNETTNDGSSLSGWTGSATQADHKTTLSFCRANGERFAGTAAHPFAVLKLGQECPSRSDELMQLVDTEDDADVNSVSNADAAAPNGEVTFPKGLTRYPEMFLHWCVFRHDQSVYLPPKDYPYGVVAAPGLPGTVASGTIHMDDENDSNEDSFSGLPVAGAMDAGPDTTLRVVATSTAPPVLEAFGPHSANVGSSVSIPFTVSDPDTRFADLSITAISMDQTVVANTGLVLSGTGGNRTLTVTPTSLGGRVTITVRANDGANTVEQTFVMSVFAPPTVTAPAEIAFFEDSPGGIEFHATDPTMSTLHFAAESSDATLVAPADVTFAPSPDGVAGDYVAHIVPRPNANGTGTLTLVVTGPGGLTTRRDVSIVVRPMSDPPTVQLDGLVPVNEGTTILLGASAFDPDGDPLTYTWSATSGAITGSGPRVNYQAGDGPGRVTVSVTVTDPSGLSATASGTVAVSNVPPQVTVNTPATIYWGVPASLSATVTDASADQAAGIGVVWKFGDGSTAPAQGTSVSHVFPAVGTYRVGVTATDKDGGQSVAFVNVTVSPRPTALRPSSVRPTGIVVGLNDAYDSTRSMAGATVLFRLNGVTYPATVAANNTATFAPPRLAPGQYPVQILFGGNSLYGPTGTAVNLVVS